MIPSCYEIERTVRELGLCPDQAIQAINHIRQRDELVRRQRVVGTARRAAA